MMDVGIGVVAKRYQMVRGIIFATASEGMVRMETVFVAKGDIIGCLAESRGGYGWGSLCGSLANLGRMGCVEFWLRVRGCDREESAGDWKGVCVRLFLAKD